ncbi:MAG: tetratricopeptide repeat protein [Bacteroidales bacterium]|nr:tetratricopeptide repeat protein [Bacteroidales bacterium]
MKKVLFLILALMTGLAVNAQSNFDARMRNAVEMMDQGLFPQAISQLEGVVKDYPKSFIPRYELAYAYLLNGDPQKAYTCLKKAKGCKDKTDQWYQLMGTMEDEYLNNPDKCMKTLQKGLKEFPNSGLLHVEMGVMHQIRKEYDEAGACYLGGIERDPMFTSNYFRAANLYLASSRPTWGLMFCEMYMLLDPYSERANAISKNLAEFMRQSVSITDSSISITLGKEYTITVDPDNMTFMMPFEVTYNLKASLSTIPAAIKGKTELDIETLTIMHRALMDEFTKTDPERPESKSLSQKHGDILFPFLKRIDDAGFFDVYCHLLYRGMGDDAIEWLEDHQSELEDFHNWLLTTPFVITTQTAFTPRTAKAYNLLEGSSE